MYRIGAFSKLTGASIRTLRYYDEIDLFKPDNIDIYTGYRYYSDLKIEEYKIITELKNVGFTLEEIKKYWNHFDDFKMIEKKRQLLNQVNTTNEKIKKLDYLRSCIHNGQFILNDISNLNQDKIKKLNTNLNIVKRIIKASYDQLLFQRGTSISQTSLAKNIKNGVATYYVIYENSSIIDDFVIYNQNNLLDISLNNSSSAFNSPELMHLIFKKLRNDYSQIIILIDVNSKENITLAKKYGFIKDDELIQLGIKYVQMKKVLK